MTRLLSTALLFLSPVCFAVGGPNFVLIVADDLGYGDPGCYGSKTNNTPNIDALASTGLRFTDFHSGGAMCSPTRASILTGCYPQRFGKIFDGALSGTKQRHLGLPLEAVTIAERLQKAGYATGCFGKWHLGYQAPFLPTRQGFDVFRGLVSGDGDFHTQIDRSGNEDWWNHEKIEMEKGYTTEMLTRHSLDFIEANQDKPFFLYLPHLAIHFPWQGPKDPPQRTAGKNWHKDKWGIIPDPGNVAPHVKAMIESLDTSVGEIVAALKKWQITNNTVVIFTSDNGGYLTYGKNFKNISSNGKWRGQKTQLYEGGHRVPAIVSWPGKIAPGITDQTAHSNDLFPTLLSLSGIETPDKTDGLNLTDLCLKGEPLPPRSLYWRSSSAGALRSGTWKLVATQNNPSRAELYDLANDPSEAKNLAETHPKKAEQLFSEWQAWNTEVNQFATRYRK